MSGPAPALCPLRTVPPARRSRNLPPAFGSGRLAKVGSSHGRGPPAAGTPRGSPPLLIRKRVRTRDGSRLQQRWPQPCAVLSCCCFTHSAASSSCMPSSPSPRDRGTVGLRCHLHHATDGGGDHSIIRLTGATPPIVVRPPHRLGPGGDRPDGVRPGSVRHDRGRRGAYPFIPATCRDRSWSSRAARSLPYGAMRLRIVSKCSSPRAEESPT